MLGFGETDDEIRSVMEGALNRSDCFRSKKQSVLVAVSKTEFVYTLHSHFADLRKIDVDCLTLGQYMQPTKRHLKVKEWSRDLSCTDTSFDVCNVFLTVVIRRCDS